MDRYNFETNFRNLLDKFVDDGHTIEDAQRIIHKVIINRI